MQEYGRRMKLDEESFLDPSVSVRLAMPKQLHIDDHSCDKHPRIEVVTLQTISTLSRTHLRKTFGMEPDCSSGSDLLISLPPCKGRYDPEHNAHLSVNVILLVVFRQITRDVSVICKLSNYIGHVLGSSMFSVRSRAFLVIIFSVPIAAVDRNYGIIQPVRI
jgi:hypothetical protein